MLKFFDGQTDRRTDRQTEGRTDRVITIGHPPSGGALSATNQRLKLKCSVAFAHIISRNILIKVLLKQRFSQV